MPLNEVVLQFGNRSSDVLAGSSISDASGGSRKTKEVVDLLSSDAKEGGEVDNLRDVLTSTEEVCDTVSCV